MDGKVTALLADSAKHLCRYLEEQLPTLSTDWWSECVLPALSAHQRQSLEKGRPNSLTGLDLAALLRVFDQNWFRIAPAKQLSTEDRNYLKEMQTVRNRWAHAAVSAVPEDDVYRDLDTIQRFAGVIQATPDFVGDIRTAKSELRNAGVGRTSAVVRPQQPTAAATTTGVRFAVGQVVAPNAQPALVGVVIHVHPGSPENRYTVFTAGQSQTYYESQLEVVTRAADAPRIVSLVELHAHLSALLVRHPSLSALYSLHAARIDFIPYQFRPVLRFVRSDRPRLLIADGVGVGKTIEAGLILRELQARREVRSVLIICPRALVTERKWELEMRRFDERFAQLDAKTLRYCFHELDLDGEWPQQYAKAILPYSLFDDAMLYGEAPRRGRGRRKGLLDIDPPPRFDLVIVDEAHHIRNPGTRVHRGVRFLCDHAEAVLFLTATPIQMGSRDLFVLLNTLRPDLVIDEQSFAHMAEPNPHINRAVDYVRAQGPGWQESALSALQNACSTAWGQSVLHGHPDVLRVTSLLRQGCEVSPEDRIAAVTSLENLHTFAGMINRTRRRDIGNFTIRKPLTVAIDFTAPQRQLHDALLTVQADVLSHTCEDVNVRFLMTTIRRQAASCLFGLAPLLGDILTRRLDGLASDEMDGEAVLNAGGAIAEIADRVKVVLDMAKGLDGRDPKLDELRRIAQDKRVTPNNRLMVFSCFRHTLRYLFDRLCADGFRVGLVHGGTPDEERVVARERFSRDKEDPDALDILLFSEVGCEGLDYQFCDCIVNYDLPWNPMRVEQRIGRIDRHGQASETVAIYNLITPGTIDAAIYDRCLWRLGVFHREVGASEEVLGDIAQQIRGVAEDMALSSDEQVAKLQQIADNGVLLIQEQQRLEEKQVELFGLRLPRDQFQREVEGASSCWLSPKALRNLVEHYLAAACGEGQQYILGDKEPMTLRLSHEARSRVLRDFQALPRGTTPSNRDWELWLKGGSQHLAVTFSAACARSAPGIAFVTPVHPLVRQAAATVRCSSAPLTAFTVVDPSLAAGDHAFAIYQWQMHGVRDTLDLQVVCLDEQLRARFIALLEHAKPLSVSLTDLPGRDVFDGLDAVHHRLWGEARNEHREEVRRAVGYRRESLATSHGARIALVQEQLAQAHDERIRRMRSSQLASAEADFTRHVQELDQAVCRADITAQPVAFGIVRVSRPGEDAGDAC